MRMHYLRVWRLVDLWVSIILLPVALMFFFLKNMSVFFIVEAFLIIIIGAGYWSRKHIFQRMQQKSEQLGLKRIGLLKYKENANEIHYEIHVLTPKNPLGKSVAATQTKVLRQFIEDITRLNEISKRIGKDVIFFGTSHTAFRRAWRKGWSKLGIESYEMDKNLDPLAPYSKLEWKSVMKKFYGTDAKLPVPQDWKTMYCILKKE